MMRRSGSRSVQFALLTAVVGALCATASCSEDGVTTSCPDRPRYQTFPLGDASVPDALSGDSAEVQQALADAIDAGCATGPSGLGSGTGGSSGAGGSAGQTSSAGEGGTSNADSAGAAGRN